MSEFKRAREGLTTQVPERTIERAPPRPEVREEDPRERAAKRAAAIRGHIGNLDEGSDEFWVDPSAIPDGWTYEWKRRFVYNLEDPTYGVHLARMGWENVPASRHPEMMPQGHKHSTIERKGLILMERPREITNEARDIEYRRARAQVKGKEDQLANAPAGQFERSNKDASLVKISKSYSPVAIPDN